MEQTFGQHLTALREAERLTGAELADCISLDEDTVLRWERDEEMPGAKSLIALSDALGVSLERLLDTGRPEKTIRKIVITGGPCAGKTTAMSWIQNAFTAQGWCVFFAAESATELINAGAAPWLTTSWRDFQVSIIKYQLNKERTLEEIARLMPQDKVLIVCDRAAMDNRGYLTDRDWRYVLHRLGMNEVDLRDGYDAVFHLVTAAKGAQQFYTCANNSARTEDIGKAIEVDDALLRAWTGHAHLRVIDNSTDFDKKMRNLISEIRRRWAKSSPAASSTSI